MSRPSLARLSFAGLSLLGASLAASVAEAQPMEYYGGRVISNVQVIQVAWTNGVDATLLQDLATFHQALLATDYLDWLAEYDTTSKVGFADGQPGSNQHIGRGTWGGSFVITPSNAKTTLTDKEIGDELAARIGAGDVPMPALDLGGNVNSLYFLRFPAGYTIDLFGVQSCSGYGGYHSTTKLGNKSVPYAVIPNCGYDFATATFVDTHELVEAITDTEAGLVTDFALPLARPLAWVQPANDFWSAPECADICQNITEEIAGYNVATSWSNFAGACVAHIPICDGVLSPPACRPCTGLDDGLGCSGETPACATAGPKLGQCVVCTAKSSGACVGVTPVCDDTTYSCVGCKSNAECDEPGLPVCDGNGACRACTSDADCAPSRCDLSDDPQKGRCVECVEDADCSGDRRCVDHACELTTSTTTNAGGGGAGGEGGAGGGSGGEESKGGCSCRVADSGGASDSGLWGALLALAAVLGSRRRRAPR